MVEMLASCIAGGLMLFGVVTLFRLLVIVALIAFDIARRLWANRPRREPTIDSRTMPSWGERWVDEGKRIGESKRRIIA